MAKFRLLAEHLRTTGILTDENVYEPGPLSLSVLMNAHDPAYVQRFIRGQLTQQEEKDIGLPWSEWLVERTLRAVSGTLLTAQLALEHGLACHLAGGTHHAFPDRGAGFCIFNDLAVTAVELVRSDKASKVMIVDCDVHQGDGTVAFFEHNPAIIPVSFHCEDNYPMEKQSGGINIPIPKGCDDDAYLEIVKQNLPTLLETHRPDFVLYDAGADVHQDDRLGHVMLTDAGILARDHYILTSLMQANISTACVIGGGYDHDHAKVARRHGLLHQAANQVWQQFKHDNKKTPEKVLTHSGEPKGL
ncbi:histone deacetylase [Maribrevibacterium harenarium]|uniref:Histone deacetylase n=2 Tax=Maribrevibacterium harenarium TaxID=2589817 RepID=A0A501X0P3_9GAMM|nr:histone deacetylase [Maribrevibacterium harenarium]